MTQVQNRDWFIRKLIYLNDTFDGILQATNNKFPDLSDNEEAVLIRWEQKPKKKILKD